MGTTRKPWTTRTTRTTRTRRTTRSTTTTTTTTTMPSYLCYSMCTIMPTTMLSTKETLDFLQHLASDDWIVLNIKCFYTKGMYILWLMILIPLRFETLTGI